MVFNHLVYKVRRPVLMAELIEIVHMEAAYLTKKVFFNANS